MEHTPSARRLLPGLPAAPARLVTCFHFHARQRFAPLTVRNLQASVAVPRPTFPSGAPLPACVSLPRPPRGYRPTAFLWGQTLCGSCRSRKPVPAPSAPLLSPQVTRRAGHGSRAQPRGSVRASRASTAPASDHVSGPVSFSSSGSCHFWPSKGFPSTFPLKLYFYSFTYLFTSQL